MASYLTFVRIRIFNFACTDAFLCSNFCINCPNLSAASVCLRAWRNEIATFNLNCSTHTHCNSQLRNEAWLETKEYSGKIKILDVPIHMNNPNEERKAYTNDFIAIILMDHKFNFIFNLEITTAQNGDAFIFFLVLGT